MKKKIIISIMMLLLLSSLNAQDRSILTLKNQTANISSDLNAILKKDGILMVSGIKDGNLYVKLGNLFADLLINELAGQKKFKPTLVNHHINKRKRNRDANWVLSGSLYKKDNFILIIYRLEEQETGGILKGWEISLQAADYEALLEKSDLNGNSVMGDEYEPNNIWDNAAEVKSSEIIEGLSFNPDDDIDWFIVKSSDEIPGEGTLFMNIETTGNNDTFLEVYGFNNGNPVLLAEGDDNGNDENAKVSIKTLTGEIYLIKVSGYYGDIYGLKISQSKIVLSDGEPNDSFKTAEKIEFGTTNLGRRIDYNGDRDYYVFQVEDLPKDGVVVVETTGNTDLEIDLYDKSENLIESDYSGYDENPRITKSLKPGLYYLMVGSNEPVNNVPYTLTVKTVIFKRDKYEPDDDISRAREIRVNEAAQVHNFQPDYDVDFLKLTISEKGSYTIVTSGSHDTSMALLDARGELIDEDDDSGTDANALIHKELSPGVYYISISNNEDVSSAIDYKIQVYGGKGEQR